MKWKMSPKAEISVLDIPPNVLQNLNSLGRSLLRLFSMKEALMPPQIYLNLFSCIRKMLRKPQIKMLKAYPCLKYVTLGGLLINLENNPRDEQGANFIYFIATDHPPELLVG
eukprot:m.277113 g.277113  ORF g.277113 m.277113 type:complete len:112 (-) comp16305_c0_seq28:8624-8959(-)